VQFETGEEERGWPIWRPLGAVGAVITSLVIVLVLLTQCGSSARANPLCAPNLVPKQTVEARRDAASATRRAQEASGQVATARPIETARPSPPPAAAASPTVPAPAQGAPPPGSPEAPAAAATAAMSPTPSTPGNGQDLEAALRAADGSQAPFFAQNAPAWGGEEYDHSITAPNGCPGPNLANCGCALTSVTNVLSTDGVKLMADGRPLDPGAVNDWASSQARRLSDGTIVSAGFAPGGNVNWNMAMAISGGARAIAPDQPLVSLRTVGGASRQQVTEDLAQGRPVILSTPRQSHWFTAEGLADDGAWLFWDPYYRDQVRKGDAFGPTSIHYQTDRPDAAVIHRSVVISTRARSLKVTDRQGRALPVVERLAWEDPTCENDGAPDFRLKQVYVPEDSGPVTIEAKDSGRTIIIVHDYGSDGSVDITVHEGKGDQTQTYGSGELTSPTPATPPTAEPTSASATAAPEPSLQPTNPGASPKPATPTPPQQATSTPVPPPTVQPSATPDLAGPPANIALSVVPAAIPCDTGQAATVTATVTDSRGRNVADGTSVSFTTGAAAKLSSISATTSGGRASTRVTPNGYSAGGITVRVSSGGISASAHVDCTDTAPPVIGATSGNPVSIWETDGSYCTGAGYPNTSQLRVTITDVSAVTARVTYSVGTFGPRTVPLTQQSSSPNLYAATFGPFALNTVSGDGSGSDDWSWLSIQIEAHDANGNTAPTLSANTAIRLYDCYIIF